MTMATEHSINDEHFSALREVCRKGTEHAATALSQMIGSPVRVAVSHACVADRSTFSSLLGERGDAVLAISLEILGGARGKMLFVFPWESTMNILGGLLPVKERAIPLGELELSCLREVGNIVASSFLNALASILNMTLIPSVPKLYLDHAGTVAEHFMSEDKGDENLFLLAQTSFFVEERLITGNLFLFPSSESVDTIMAAVRITTER